MAVEQDIEFRVPLIGSESLRVPSIKCLDEHKRERFIPVKVYARRRILDGCKRDWGGTPYDLLIAETVYDIGVCEYGYTVARSDFLRDGRIVAMIRLYKRKRNAVDVFMTISGEPYEGK